MKLQKITIVLFIIFSSCSSKKEQNNEITMEESVTSKWSQEKFLVHPDSTYSVDLTDLTKVSKNLNGYWVSENQLNGTTILWLSYRDTILSSFWTYLEFNEEVSKSGEVSLPSCQDIGQLIMLNNSVHISFSGLSRMDTVKVTEISNEKFTLAGETYLRHQGPFE